MIYPRLFLVADAVPGAHQSKLRPAIVVVYQHLAMVARRYRLFPTKQFAAKP